MLTVIERDYMPELHRHLTIQMMNTPTTNEHFCTTPLNNTYGSALTPRNVSHHVPSQTPFRNLWLTNATTGFPNINRTVKTNIELMDNPLTQ